MLTVVRSANKELRSERAVGPCTGQMWREILQQQNGVSVSNNFFTPCSRTYWHTHDGGQLLIVESGEGFVGTADEVIRLGVGDMVWTPAHVRHWHGGCHDRSMLHLAVSFGGVDWQEEVSEELYELAQEA